MPIGESLRRARTDRGLELEQVSDETKIRVRYLRALENEDWGTLPAPAYARGFLRTYAAFLGLDADALVEEFRRTVGDRETAPAEERRAVPPGLGGSTFPSRGVLVAAGAVVAVLAVLFVIGQVGGGSGGKETAGTQGGGKRHAHRHHKHHAAPKPPPQPTKATIEIKPTGTVWVCLEDLSGKRLVDGQILTAGDTQGPFQAAGFQLGLGNGEATITANGKPLAVPSSPNPLAFHIAPGSAKSVSAAKRPTCA
jgi:cytoskeleton protein RodZ